MLYLDWVELNSIQFYTLYPNIKIRETLYAYII